MKEKLQAELKNAMRAKDQVKLNTIRSVLSAIQYEEIEKKTDKLSEEAEVLVLGREVKKRREEVEFADKAGRPELKEQLAKEIATLEFFLPEQIPAAELEKIITAIKAENAAANMGVIMKTLKEKFGGQYDSKMASELAKKIAG